MNETLLKQHIINLLQGWFPDADVRKGPISNSEDEIQFTMDGERFGIIVTQME